MANFHPQKMNFAEINGGNKYTDADGLQSKTINDIVQSTMYSQMLATNQPNITEINGNGDPSVTVEEVGGSPRFKFANLGNTQKVEILSKKVENLESRLNDDYFVTVDGNYRFHQTPNNAMPFAEVTKIGGMTYRDGDTNTLKDAKVTALNSYNENLITPRNPSTGTTNGLTYTVNADGSINILGAANADTYILVSTPTISSGKSYFISGCPARGSRTFRMEIQWRDKIGAFKAAYDLGSGAVLPTPDADYTTAVYIFVPNGTVMNNDIFKPMLNYGSAALPYVKRAQIASLPIPQAVQDLEGWGVGYDATNYNHIVWKPDEGIKKYVQNCYLAVINGSENGQFGTTGAGATYPNTYIVGVNIASGYKANLSMYGFSDVYERIENTELGKKKGIMTGFWTGYFYITDPDFTDLATAKAKLAANPVHICFYSNTVKETDISHILSDDNFIEVEGGGVITPENGNQLSAPLQVVYQVK